MGWMRCTVEGSANGLVVKKMGCVWLIGSTPGCGYSNLGSNPSILPNLVHIVKSWDGLWDPRNRLKKSLYSLFPIFNTDCFFSGRDLHLHCIKRLRVGADFFYFFIYSQPGPSFINLFVQYSIHRAFCRPSDHSGARPWVEIWTWYGRIYSSGRDTYH